VTTKAGAILMAALLALYLVLIGWRAVQFVATGEPVAVGIGVALIVLPVIAAWALWREIAFGARSHALVRRLESEGALDLGISRLPSGRPERAAADAAFPSFQAAAEAEPQSWRAWLRLGLAYDAAGDRRRARAAVRRAITLERSERSEGSEGPAR
jgi:tetratricopeptide (TPR) repeat protein